MSLNNSTSSNGTLPDLFLLSSNHIKIAKTINPKIISIMLVATSLVRVKIPSTSKRRHIPESIAPIISRSLLDSVGLKSGILFCIAKINKMNINSNAKVYLQLKKVVISPPRSGAKISASPAITPRVAKAIVRFLPEYIPLIIETMAGSINAAATPLIAAHPTKNIVTLELNTAANIPIPKSAAPITNSFFLPTMS